MDKEQLLKERGRLQAALDRHNAVEPTEGRHVGLIQRIAQLDRRIALSHDV